MRVGVIPRGLDHRVLDAGSPRQGRRKGHVFIPFAAADRGLETLQLSQRKTEVGARVIASGEIENEGLARSIQQLEVAIQLRYDSVARFMRRQSVELQRLGIP